jgi:hypothetical protein
MYHNLWESLGIFRGRIQRSPLRRFSRSTQRTDKIGTRWRRVSDPTSYGRSPWRTDCLVFEANRVVVKLEQAFVKIMRYA